MTQPKVETYNGWPNWATWNVALWFANDEGLYESLRCHWEGCHEPGSWTPDLAQAHAKEMLPCGTLDMKGAKDFDTIDWAAIAEAWNEE